MEKLRNILEKEIPKLMDFLPSHVASVDDVPEAQSNPFAVEAGKDAYVSGAQGWAINSTQKSAFDVKFHSLKLNGGKASGAQVMNVMVQSSLSRETLKKVWDLSDIDRDGKMDAEEFALCMYLIDMIKNGLPLQDTLPMSLVPPGKRKLLEFS